MPSAVAFSEKNRTESKGFFLSLTLHGSCINLEATVPKFICKFCDRGSWILSFTNLLVQKSNIGHFCPLFPAPEFSSSDNLFNLFLNLRNSLVHFGWSSSNLSYLQGGQLHLNLLFRLWLTERHRWFYSILYLPMKQSWSSSGNSLLSKLFLAWPPSPRTHFGPSEHCTCGRGPGVWCWIVN